MRSIAVAAMAGALMATVPAFADTVVLGLDELQKSGLEIQGLQPFLTFETKSPTGRARIASAFLGKGSNFWGPNKTLSTQCVAFHASDIINAPTATGSTSSDNWNVLNQVSTLSDHFKSESLGVSANVTYKIFSLGASGNSSSSNHFSSTSRYIDIDKGVVSDSFFIAEVPGARRLRVMPGIPNEDFARICGQSFVWKVSFGTIIKGTIDFETQLNASTSTNGTSISAGITGIISGAVNTSKAWSDLGQISSIAYSVKGGPSKSSKLEEWIPQIKDFGSNPTDSQSNDVIIFHTASYRTLLGAGDIADVNIDALGTLTNLQFSLTDAIQQLSDRQKALISLTHINEPETVIRDDVNKLADYIDALQPTFKTCSEAQTPQDVKNCRNEAKKVGLPPIVTSLTFK